QTIIELSGFPLAHGHSSVFDLVPEIGVLGAAIYALTYLEAVLRALRLRGPRWSPPPPRLEASRATLLGVAALTPFGFTEPMSTIPLGWFVIALLATGLIPAASGAGVTPRPARGRRRADRPNVFSRGR